MNGKQLGKQLTEASDAYYNTGETVISDAEFDAKKEELRQLNPDHPFLARVGAPLAAHLEKVKHNIPMGSLNNANNEEEFEAWLNKITDLGGGLVVMHKLDGSSIEIVYKRGVLVQAITR